MASSLALSLIGYALLAAAGTDSRLSVVTGLGFLYLGIGVIAALGTDLVVGAAPPERSGSASALSETVQELGIAAGVALLGSLTTAIYRTAVEARPGLPRAVAEPFGDSLSGAASVADQLPAGALRSAREAFAGGLNTAAIAAGIAIAGASVVCFRTLRHIGPIGRTTPETEPIASTHVRGDDR
ncbi:hypothetical protein ABT001_10290 [Streptomyces sp. NPDC002793]|uniref:hypothetical protein n=1 Tax=Streptomyces sp. NPDC002793 TaxID=3154432 RepID=UPI00332B1616